MSSNWRRTLLAGSAAAVATAGAVVAAAEHRPQQAVEVVAAADRAAAPPPAAIPLPATPPPARAVDVTYTVRNLGVEVTEADGTVLQPAELGEPTRGTLRIEANGDYVAETTAVVSPALPGAQNVRQVWSNARRELRTFVNGVEQPEDPEAKARRRNSPVRPQPHLALTAYGADFLLHQGDVLNGQAHAAGRRAARAEAAADCSGARCAKVTFTRTLEKGDPGVYRTLPSRAGGDEERTELVFDPATRQVHLWREYVNDAVAHEFKVEAITYG